MESPILRDGEIAVLDEECRCGALYGPIFKRLGVQPIWAHGLGVEEIMQRKPSLILLSMEWGIDMRLVSAAARRANIPVVYVIDGAMEWSYLWSNNTWIRPNGTNLQPLIGSDLCVFGQHQARIFASMGLANRIHVVGLPRLDGISRERIVTTGARPRIVVATSRTWAHDVEHKVMVLRGLRDLRAWFAQREEIDVVWRIGADLAEEINVEADISGTMSEVLARATALISLPSTCLLEGMHKGIPVAQLEYRPVPLYTATAWEIRSAAHIPTVVHELLYPPPSKLAYQDACFSDELELDDATGRLAQVIREALQRPEPYGGVSDPQPVRIHGKLDFRQIYSELSCFAMDEHAILQYELSAAYGALTEAKKAKHTYRQECQQLIEAFTQTDLRKLRVYSFLDRLSTCNAGAPTHGRVQDITCNIDGQAARALRLKAPIEAGFVLPTGAAGKLTFALSQHPEDWAHFLSGPCRFTVQANGQVLFDVTIDQRTDPADRKWWFFEVPIPASENDVHVIILSTHGVGGDDYRSGLWRTPHFIWAEESDDAHGDLRPRLASTGQFYVPGRTLA